MTKEIFWRSLIPFFVLFVVTKVSSADTSEMSVLEQGIYYDVSSQTTHLVEFIDLDSLGNYTQNDGSGILSNETKLTPEELDLVSGVEATYAPYEISEGNHDGDGNFIPFSVILPDTRELVVNTTEFPERAIVQFNFTEPLETSVKGCTGFMIEKNFVLTAGHCVYKSSVNEGWNKILDIYPARNGGVKPFGSCAAVKLYSIKGWVENGDKLHDIGAIKLNCQVGDATGWLDLKSIGNGAVNNATKIVGYPCDKKPAGRQYVSRDEIRGLDNLKIFYQNDTWGCMSGSPVFVDETNDVIAVHTNGLHNGEPWKSNNAGTKLTEARIQQIRTWINR